MVAGIAGEELRAVGLTAEEARRELALALYGRGRLTEGQAAQLAGMDRWAFDELLGERGLPIHYGVREVEEDIETLRELGQLP
jgi:predicted HTH domain antitoxin